MASSLAINSITQDHGKFAFNSQVLPMSADAKEILASA